MASGYNINIVKGETFLLDIIVNNNSGVPWNFSGYSGETSLRRSLSENSNEIGEINLEFLSGISGGIRLSMAATGTEDLPVTQAVYDVDVYDQLGTSTNIIYGYANIFADAPISSSGSTTVTVGGGGGGSVTSVANKIGNVILYVEDINGLTEYLATGVSGVSLAVLNATGQYLLGEINNINTVSGNFTGQFYPLLTNPAGYITSLSATGQLTGAFYPLTSNPLNYITSSQTGAFASVVSLNATGNNLSQLISALNNWTGFSTGLYYPLSSNPAGYLISSDLASYATQVYVNNISGLIRTDLNIISAWTGSATGLFYPYSSNPAGYITSLAPTGQLTGAFYPLNENPAGYLTSLSATGQLTGQFVSHSQTGDFVGSAELLSASGYLEGLISASSAGVAALNGQSGVVNISVTGNLTLSAENGTITISGNTGQLTGAFYPLSSNPSNYITSSQTGAFASDIELANATGSLTGEFYPRLSNPANYLTSADLSSYATTAYVNGVSGVIDTRLVTITNWTGSTTGLYYPLSSNPANYITSSQTGVFASDIELANATGALTGAFYPLSSNPALYLTGIIAGTNITVTNHSNGSFTINSTASGSSSTGQLTGAFYPLTGNPSNFVSSTSGTVTVQGGGTILDGHLLIGASGTNAFEQGNLYGTSGAVIISGSGTLGVSLNYSTISSNLSTTFYPRSTNPSGFVTGLVAGTNVTVSDNGNYTWTVNSTASGGSGSSSTPFGWLKVTGDRSVNFNSGYICSGTSNRISLSLPSSASIGDYFRITSIGVSGWRITQNSGQQIHFGDVSSTAGTGGYVQSTSRRDSVEIICVETNTEFQILTAGGNILLN